MNEERIKILLVEDDEDDYTIIRDTLDDIANLKFELDWAKGYEEALDCAEQERHDLCLMDYRLGANNGIELMRELLLKGFEAPIIILTGYGDHDVDMEAMKEGASDYLEKENLTPDHLERSIRYSIEQARMINALKVSENKLRALSVRILEAQEKERKLIAQELHDGIGASLTAIRYALEQKLSQRGKEKQQPNEIPLEQIIDMVRETIDEARNISSNLRPSILDDLGLLTAIRSLCREFREVYQDVRIEPTMEIREEDVPEPLKIVIYRIVQEALNNVFKHSGANRVHLSLLETREGIELSITDNGRGFDMEVVHPDDDKNTGIGLQGMKERAELSNGTFEITSEEGKGTVVRAFWSVGGDP